MAPAPVLPAPPMPPAPLVVSVPAPPRSQQITQPEWISKPSGADLARYYPQRAQRLGIEGEAVIGCTVDRSGRLAACSVMRRSPARHGFGAAALKMSRAFRMRPMTRDGTPVAGGKVAIPIRFALPRY